VIGVTLLAILATGIVLSLPWALHRGTDTFRWQSVYSSSQNRFAWASTSNFAFAFVLITGRGCGLVGAAGAFFLVSGGYAFAFHRRYRSVRTMADLCAALEKAPGSDAVRALDVALERLREDGETRTHGYATWAQWSFRAAAQAVTAGYPADALRWIDALDPRRLDHGLRALHALRCASLCIELGDRDGARAAMMQVARPAQEPLMEQGFGALEGLLDALEGDAPAALARADQALAAPLEASVRTMWRVVRAHALERANAPSAAREVLSALQAEHGDRALRRIVSQRGPASAAAATLLAARAPYR
jgi:hypothetical protein